MANDIKIINVRKCVSAPQKVSKGSEKFQSKMQFQLWEYEKYLKSKNDIKKPLCWYKKRISDYNFYPNSDGPNFDTLLGFFWDPYMPGGGVDSWYAKLP